MLFYTGHYGKEFKLLIGFWLHPIIFSNVFAWKGILLHKTTSCSKRVAVIL